jgi:hypothetical protein
MKEPKEPREYEKNVHFWLRKIFYFVHFVDVNEVTVQRAEDEDAFMKEQGEDPNKGDAEQVMREKLGLDRDKITKEEAEEACRKLYAMFNMPLDEEVLKYMEDRRCAGGWPRSM